MIQSRSIAGNIHDAAGAFEGLLIDRLPLEWHELDKGILRKFTKGGQELGFRNLYGTPLQNGDVLFVDARCCIVVDILPCPCLVVYPKDSLEMARVCAEIGNRHLPIAIRSSKEVLLAYEEPLRRLFAKRGIDSSVEDRILEQTKTLKIHAWTRKTKFKITLAKTIHESFVDPVAD